MAGMRAFVSLLFLGASVYGKISKSKLSIHTGWGHNSQIITQGGKPSIIKLLDNFDSAPLIKKLSPGIIIVGRNYLANQPVSGDPAAAAGKWWAGQKAKIMAHPAIDYWEGYNEPFINSYQDLEWIGLFDAERVKLMAQAGKNASIGNFAAGTPDETNGTVIEAYYPAIDAAKAHGGILGLHEYSAPDLQGAFTGSVCGGSGWLTGRYRKLYNEYLIKTNRVIPLVISELGVAGFYCDITHCNWHKGGWKTACTKGWVPEGHKNCDSYYMSQLEWYDQVMRCDSYVLGATIFAIDIPGWGDYDITPLTGQLTAYLKSQQ